MKIRNFFAALTFAGLPALANAADPTIDGLIKRMQAYEEQVRKLKQRLDQTEKRAQAAEPELMRAKAEAGAAPAVAAIPAAVPPAAAVTTRPVTARASVSRVTSSKTVS